MELPSVAGKDIIFVVYNRLLKIAYIKSYIDFQRV